MRPISRRRFLTTLAKTAALAPLAPLIKTRPAFGQTMFRTRHVVVMLFGGGTRYRESIEMAEGPVMPNLLGQTLLGGGAAPELRIDSETEMGDPRALMLPPPLAAPLRLSGSLCTRVRYAAGDGGHTEGEAAAVCGAYNDKGPRLDDYPEPATLFEHLRKRSGLPATATWLVQLAPSYGALSYSRHPDFGPRYGASYLDPSPFVDTFALAAVLRRPPAPITPATIPNLAVDPGERAAADRVRAILDGNAPQPPGRLPPEDAARVSAFLQQDLLGAGFPDRGLSPTTDAVSLYAAERILSTFRPALTFVNAFEIDACHQNYNEYLNQIRVADAAVAMLWNTIQSIPEMKDATTLFVIPEHGRDSYSNDRGPDLYGRQPVDHGADSGPGGFRDIWCLAVGPDIRTDYILETQAESVDVGATIAALLGFDQPYVDALRPLTARDETIRGGRVLTEILR